ncbi:MAG: acyloxyacyl hydrolase [Rubrivivax sp.]|nr:acyloxyacyl hydrolase [Rubrivivax sp.]
MFSTRHLTRFLRSALPATGGSACVALLLAAAASLPAAAQPAPPDTAPPAHPFYRPDAAFVQAGRARDAHALVFGATWPWSWRRELWGGELGGYWEASFGRWYAELDDGQRSSNWVTQLGVTPVLRWHPGHAGGSAPRRWFVEGGIGANVLLPIYRSRDKRFSTTFNFGDHLGVGWYVGDGEAHELVLRIQHFSNAGIRHPNPGEDFVQLRYTWRL